MKERIEEDGFRRVGEGSEAKTDEEWGKEDSVFTSESK